MDIFRGNVILYDSFLMLSRVFFFRLSRIIKRDETFLVYCGFGFEVKNVEEDGYLQHLDNF